MWSQFGHNLYPHKDLIFNTKDRDRNLKFDRISGKKFFKTSVDYYE